MRAHCQVILSAALLSVAFAPSDTLAQTRGARNPVFLAGTFKGPQGEPQLGVEVAEAIRVRMLRTFPFPPRPGALRVVRKSEVDDQLKAAAYPVDSALSTTDFQVLSRTFGADESMEGSVRRTAAGVEARARFYLLSNVAAPEVLPVVVEKNAEAAGRKIAEIYIQARKELPEYEKCRNALIQNQPEQAVVAAKAAMAIYDKGVLPRACLLTAYSKLVEQNKMPLDSVERVAKEIVAVDPSNEIALNQLLVVYRTRGDAERAIAVSVEIFELNTANTDVGRGVVDYIGSTDFPRRALPVVETMVKNNPSDASIIETQWKLLLRVSQWKAAIIAGEQMIKLDTSKADTTFFRRQVGAAIQDSQPQLVLQYLSRATTKFPRDVLLLQAYLAELRRQGQVQHALEAAKKVIAVDPAAVGGYATVIALYSQLGRNDSAVTFARQALATNSDTVTSNSIATGLLTAIKPAMDKAQADTSSPDTQRANWTEVFTLSAAIDSIVPRPATAFFMSFAAFNLASNAVNRVQGLAQARNTSGACAELKTAADMILAVDLNMSRGGRYNPGGAAQILQAASTLRPYIAETRTRLSCR